jgi:hypothetical protein
MLVSAMVRSHVFKYLLQLEPSRRVPCTCPSSVVLDVKGFHALLHLPFDPHPHLPTRLRHLRAAPRHPHRGKNVLSIELVWSLSDNECWLHSYWSAVLSFRPGSTCFCLIKRLSPDSNGWQSDECILTAPAKGQRI